MMAEQRALRNWGPSHQILQTLYSHLACVPIILTLYPTTCVIPCGMVGFQTSGSFEAPSTRWQRTSRIPRFTTILATAPRVEKVRAFEKPPRVSILGSDRSGPQGSGFRDSRNGACRDM